MADSQSKHPPLSLFLSLRYLRPKRTFVSIITLIAIILVMIGVTAMVVVLSIMNGLGDRMRESIAILEPHLQIAHPDGPLSAADAKTEQERLEKFRTLATDIRPYTQGQAILDYNQRVKTVFVFGIPDAPGPMINKLKARIEPAPEGGSFDLSPGHAVVSSLLGQGMHLELGSEISLLTLANGRELLDAQNESRQPKDLIPPFKFKISGFYDAGAADPTVIFVNLAAGQELYGLKDGKVDGLAVDLKNAYRADEVRDVVKNSDLLAVPGLEVTSWIGRNKRLFDALATERVVMALMISMIIVVAAFAIMNTTITVTTQKRREIGLMRAVGARVSQVVSVFVLQGLITGLIGTALGLLLAFLLLAARGPLLVLFAYIGGVANEATREYLMDMPAHIRGADLLFISVGSFLACALSALPPAFFAARLQAANALRNLA